MTVDHRGVREVILLMTDTLHTENLSQGIANYSQPTVSPQGDRVAFVAGESGAQKIKIAPIQGHTYILTDDKQTNDLGKASGIESLSICEESDLSWSPDGTFLAFFACSEDVSMVVTVDIVTRKMQIVPHTDNANKRPRSLAWLDNTRIVFVEQASSDVDRVFVIKVDGTDKILVFSGP